jgi:2,5-diketo-D-gluconate reductase B
MGPAIGLGTYQLVGREAPGTLQAAFDLGYRLLDTAQLYNNEAIIGEAIHHSGIPRKDFTIVTKVWPSHYGADQFIPSVRESLNKLQTDYVDVLLVHWPHPSLAVEQYIHLLAEAKEEQLAMEIGVSNFNIAQLEAVQRAQVPMVTNEVEYHPWVDQQKLMQWMRAHHLPVIAYTPLGRGRLMKDRQLGALCEQYARSPAQLVLCWMMQKEDIIAIPKASSASHLRENINVFDFALSAADMKIMDHLSSKGGRIVGALPGARWD